MSARNKRIVYVFIIFGIFAMILNIVANYTSFNGEWSTVTQVYVGAIPYLAFMAIALYFGLTRQIGMIGTASIFGLAGIMNGGLFYYLNTAGVWIDEYVNATTTITDIVIVTVIIWIIFGFIIGSKSR